MLLRQSVLFISSTHIIGGVGMRPVGGGGMIPVGMRYGGGRRLGGYGIITINID